MEHKIFMETGTLKRVFIQAIKRPSIAPLNMLSRIVQKSQLNTMSQPQLQDSHTVAQHSGSLRRLINSLGVDGRGRFLAFWKDVRKSLNNQDATITAQQAYIAQLQRPSPIAPPARPRSSNSVVAIRQAMEQDMQAKAYLLMSRASRTVRSIYNLDPAWALNFVNEQRNENIRHELNCWMSGNAAAHPNDYTKINMRGTYMPGSNPPRKFPAQPFGHQMGIVAGGYGHMLLLTFPGGDYEVCLDSLYYRMTNGNDS
jgi:hypothetical protein